MINRKNSATNKLWIWLIVLSPIFSFWGDFSIGQHKTQIPVNSELVDTQNPHFSKDITLSQIIKKQLPKNLFTQFYTIPKITIRLVSNQLNKVAFSQITHQFIPFLNIQINLPILIFSAKEENSKIYSNLV